MPSLLIIRSFFVLFLLLSFQVYSQHWTTKARQLHGQADYKKCISLIEQYSSDRNISHPHSNLFLVKADCHLKLVEPEKYLAATKNHFKVREHFTVVDSLIYTYHLAHYYHYLLRTDSSVVLAEQSMKIFHRIKNHLSDSLKTDFFIAYANCMRNKRFPENDVHDWRKDQSLTLRRQISINTLRTAHKYALPSQKHRLFRVLATTYNDLVHFFNTQKSDISQEELKTLFDTCLGFYSEALKHREKIVKNDQLFKAQVYSLLGLTYQYAKEYKIADGYYEQAINQALADGEVHYVRSFVNAVSWKGWNLSERYHATGNIEYLKASVETYERGVHYYLGFFDKHAHETEGMHDGYRFSILHKLPNSLFLLYNETGNPEYMDKALYYADMDSYLTYRKRRKTTDSITVSDLQNLIEPGEAMIVYISCMYPDKLLALIINKSESSFVLINKGRIVVGEKVLEKMMGITGIKDFKQQAYGNYSNIFKPLAPHLKNIENLIIIPASSFAGLNFELLIEKPSNEIHLWKKLPYLFKKYNISYALSPSIFRDNYFQENSTVASIGVLQGEFTTKTNLIFAKKLTQNIQKNYRSELITAIRKNDLMSEISEHNIFLAVGHGEGSLHNSYNTLAVNDSVIISAKDFYNEHLNTELFITTACNTNIAKTYFSEGLSGGFSKALIYSGVRSTLTTNWTVDDKSSHAILLRFFHYLKKGEKRSQALWLAKKDYWANNESDDLFKPFYWSSFQLTGKTSPILIIEPEKNYYLYLLASSLFLVSLFFFFKRRSERRNIGK